MELSAVIRKGEKQYVAVCPELDVVSQGYNIEEAIKNLKEAVDLYIEEMGLPEGIGTKTAIFARFEVKENAKVASSVRT